MPEKTLENGFSGSPPADHLDCRMEAVGKIYFYLVKMNFSEIISFKGIV
jgi:hypothetical protein